jgi:4-amino-4-deoxy-L-arabinose transferase-like glycosyltransferase
MLLRTAYQSVTQGATFGVALLAVVIIGVLIRFADVNRPLDDRSLASWREADYVQIARNFERESLNILYPQVDWRGDTPGFAEMELPVVPWIGAALYRAFGYNEAFLRLVSATLSAAGLLVFVVLCRRWLPAGETLFATAAFAVSPLLFYLSSAMQPEPLMLLLSMLAVLWAWQWFETPRFWTLMGAALATAAAILAKLSAAYLGLILAYVVVRKLKSRALLEPRIYVAALVALLPPLLWYAWSHDFWTSYGLSLGVSNETHTIGLDMLWPPRFLYGILKAEILAVFTPIGVILALLAMRMPWRQIEPFVVWYGAIWIFYVAAGRTTGDYWAFYYHSASVAPACLLMASGMRALVQGDAIPQQWSWLSRRQQGLAALLTCGALVSLVIAAMVLIHKRDQDPSKLAQTRACSQQFARQVPSTEKIAVRGGTMVDDYGKPVAYNESIVFAWMDRKGFNYGDQELSVATLEDIARRGGRYWMVGKSELQLSGLQAHARNHYRLIDDCADGYLLFDLVPSSAHR